MVGESAADRFLATALSCGDDARARERQWRAARDAGPDVTAAAPDRREQRTTLPPAPTDKRLAPTVDQFSGSGHLELDRPAAHARQAMTVPAMWVLNGTNGVWIR